MSQGDEHSRRLLTVEVGAVFAFILQLKGQRIKAVERLHRVAPAIDQ